LANAHGDVRNAANMLEGCVVQFGMQNPTLRKRRKCYAICGQPADAEGREEHLEKHVGTIAFRSRRALVSKMDLLPLLPIDGQGHHPIPWNCLTRRKIANAFQGRFRSTVQELEASRYR